MKARAVIKEQEFQICAAEKPLLVKILFEEVSFKASFEGREGRAVTENERKRIPVAYVSVPSARNRTV